MNHIPWLALILACTGCPESTLNRIDPIANIGGGDGGWVPDNTQPEDIPNCGMIGCSGGLGVKRDAGEDR